MPNLVDMTAMNELAVAWAVSAAGILFLVLSASHNRRSGYQKKRVEQSGIAEALGWLAEFRASLSPEDGPAIPATAVSLSPGTQPHAASQFARVASLTASRPEVLNQH